MTDLAALIERLEKASGSDRDLDVDVAWALGLTVIKAVLPSGPDNWQVWNPKQPRYVTWDLPRYTATTQSRHEAIAALKARLADTK